MKLVRNMTDPSARKYWEASIEIARGVNRLPAWERGGLYVDGLDEPEPAAPPVEAPVVDSHA